MKSDLSEQISKLRKGAVRLPEIIRRMPIRQFRKKVRSFEDFYPQTETWIEARIYPSPDGMAIYVQDTTARKLAELEVQKAHWKLKMHAQELEDRVAERTSELAETNSHLEAFVYSIAHDLRAPLRSIQAFSSLLLEEYGIRLDESGKEYAERVTRSAERMDALVLV